MPEGRQRVYPRNFFWGCKRATASNPSPAPREALFVVETSVAPLRTCRHTSLHTSALRHAPFPMSGVSLCDSPKLESLCENDFDMRSNSPESLISRAERHWSVALHRSHTGSYHSGKTSTPSAAGVDGVCAAKGEKLFLIWSRSSFAFRQSPALGCDKNKFPSANLLCRNALRRFLHFAFLQKSAQLPARED